MFNNAIARLAIIVTVIVPCTADRAAHGGPPSCAVTETNLLRAPVDQWNVDEFGRALATDGDLAVVGCDQLHPGVGAAGGAFILERQGDAWLLGDPLLGAPIATGDLFGSAVAIDGFTAVVGAPNRDIGAINTGAVFVFRFNGAGWPQEQMITAPDLQGSRIFGTAVAIDGDVLWIGAPGDHHLGFLFSGAVYRYRYDGAQWNLEEKIVGTDSRDLRRLGNRLDSEPTRLVAAGGATGDHRSISVFDLVEETWIEQDIITCPDSPRLPSHSFGDSVSLDGDRLAVGMPTMPADGRAYVFERDRFGQWAWVQTIVSPTDTGTLANRFGQAVALSNSTLVITASLFTPGYPQSSGPDEGVRAGVGFVYRSNFGVWSPDHLIRRLYVENSFNQPPPVNDELGTSAAINDDDILLGAAFLESELSGPAGAVLTFDVLPPDCDGNGVADVCDIDCNHNLVPDACDIASLISDDCDSNGQPDECQSPHDYVLDSGTGTGVWGPSGGGDYIWLNQFNVVEGGERLTHIAVPWTGFTPHGTPATLLVYDDPNNDGDAHDAVLLSTSPATATDRFGLSPIPTFSIHPITPTVVGEAGDSFFVGAYVQCLPDVYVAMADNAPALQRSWRALNLFGQGDIVTLTNNPSFGNSPANYLLRALALDCNANGAWDDCDISTGASLDANLNGIPDECEGPTMPCPADIAPAPNGDGMVNVQDLLAVVGTWGPCANPNNCPADIAPPGGDNVVNVQDLLAVIGAWGTCP